VPAEFTGPALPWLLANGFGTLSAVINEAMTTYGYGDYREVPLVSGDVRRGVCRRNLLTFWWRLALRPAVLHAGSSCELAENRQELQDWYDKHVRFAFDRVG
jgi:hypothetical protein